MCIRDRSVEYRKVSDVEVGLFLSGGLDSSLLGKLMKQNSDSSLKAFNVDFEENFEGYRGELKEARYASSEIGINLNEEKINFDNFKEIFDIDLYHPDARVWEVTDKDGSHLALFIGDYFTRSNKRGGAWMSSFKSQSNLDGSERPIVVNVCNFPAPVGDNPSLLSFENVVTLFHEFGHAMHGILTNVTYSSMAGTSGPRDFIELPSQLLEHWASEPEVLKSFAKHYETGESIPDELIEKILKASKFNQGFINTEYLAASLLDMDWHTISYTDPLKAVSYTHLTLPTICSV